MLPSLAMTFSLSTVSLLPTTSDSTLGRYFSTHGSSPSADGGWEEEEVVVVVDVVGFVGDGVCFFGVFDVEPG